MANEDSITCERISFVKSREKSFSTATPGFHSYLEISICWAIDSIRDKTCGLGCASSRRSNIFRAATFTREVGFSARTDFPRDRRRLGVAIPARRSWLGEDGPPDH